MCAASFFERQNRVSVDRRNASQPAFERARRVPSARSGMRSAPRRSSPAAIRERDMRVLPRAFQGGREQAAPRGVSARRVVSAHQLRAVGLRHAPDHSGLLLERVRALRRTRGPTGRERLLSCQHAQGRHGFRRTPGTRRGWPLRLLETAACGSWNLADQASSQACTRSSHALTPRSWGNSGAFAWRATRKKTEERPSRVAHYVGVTKIANFPGNNGVRSRSPLANIMSRLRFR